MTNWISRKARWSKFKANPKLICTCGKKIDEESPVILVKSDEGEEPDRIKICPACADQLEKAINYARKNVLDE